MSPPRKRVRRTFSACWTCRRRRVRCDGVVPGCTPCRKHSVACEGYSVELVWVDPSTGKYPPLSRRSLDSAHTWDGWPILDDEQLERLIDGDTDGSGTQIGQLEANPFTVFETSNNHRSPKNSPYEDLVQLHHRVNRRDIHEESKLSEKSDCALFDEGVYVGNFPFDEFTCLEPFSDIVGPHRHSSITLDSPILLDTLDCLPDLYARCEEELTNLGNEIRDVTDSIAALPKKSQIPRSISPIPNTFRSNSDDAAVFYHYMTWVAPLMVPVDDADNPWKSVYPSTALQDTSPASCALYHAILAQAAFNLANLYGDTNDDGPKKTAQGLEHYGASLHKLYQCLGSSTEEEYDACMATLYTLVITGAYARQKLPWRDHFGGAGGMVTKFLGQQPWAQSSRSWVISQSLALSFEIAQTSNTHRREQSSITDTLLGGVSSKCEFGFTIGSSGQVLQVISNIRLLVERMATGDIPENPGELIQKYIAELTSPSESTEHFDIEEIWENTPRKDRAEYLQRLHLRLFRNAAIIYLFRTVLNVPPQGVVKYVSTVLQDTLYFIQLHGGAVSMWPVFIAAVEAYEVKDQQIVEQWFDISGQLGIQNRRTAREVIRAVWEKRSQEAKNRGLKQSQIAIDWREVQQFLGLDLLLL
ncbi:fungal specific transcription factor domain-containing protein [Trichoderma breve]|uniref:Fungal specific transcription factor domain-containing protein n=1 Tax=Trichoderma breve TaxID=2034170 RepID=A0A9W9E1M1_9HYPO|nr:fungal specific transcription factor domain-containing protein [Trichoderma breve]KAJ4854658.1 fungal specific transcription factor domain-containing protein [Trichoderma breve]